jgi:hypothetical protein
MGTSCRFGLSSEVVYLVEIRICHAFDGVVSRLNELLDIS